MTANRTEFLTDASRKWRQVATLEDTLLHEDPTKVNDNSTYRQRIRNAADNYDPFLKTSGGKSLRARCTHMKWTIE